MNSVTFRAFAREAMALQMDDDTPGDYVMVKAAVEAKFGIVKRAGWGNAMELGGLGVLAAPAASNLAGHPMKDRTKDVAEVGGLGMLAAPYAHEIAKRRSAGYAASGVGQKLTKFFEH